MAKEQELSVSVCKLVQSMKQHWDANIFFKELLKIYGTAESSVSRAVENDRDECGAVSPKSTKAKISKFQTQRHFFKIYVHGYKNIKFFSKKFYFQFWHNSGRSLPYFKQKLKILLV